VAVNHDLLFMQEAIEQRTHACPTCGGEMIQKSKARLMVVGLVMVASAGFALFLPIFRIPAVIIALTAFYLFFWVTVGKARWCQNCKRFPSGD
jgi:hypothetical protein